MKNQINLCVLLLLVVSLNACLSDDKKLADMEEYTGPLSESENVEINLSESTVTKIIMKGQKQLQHQNGDIEFPEGIEINFFDSEGIKTSVLTAQRGFKSAEENIYKATGDVVVVNLKKQETLRSEELYWNPETEKIYTEKFVTVQTPTELIRAEGLIAPQDFSTYEFTKGAGEFVINEN